MPRPIYAEAQPIDGTTDQIGRELEGEVLDAGFWRYVREKDGRVWLVTLGPQALLVSDHPGEVSQASATPLSARLTPQNAGEADA